MARTTRLDRENSDGETPGSSVVALAGCMLSRPASFDGGIEITAARPAARHFPTRIAEGLGVCLKFGDAHAVTSDGRALTFPANALCVRYPGCTWSSETALAGFLAVDIAPRLLPSGLAPGRMRFLHRAALPGLDRLVTRLLVDEEPLNQQEALAALIDDLHACDALAADDLHDGVDRRRVVGRARDFLASCFDTNPTLDQVAGAAGANKFILLRHFRRELGITPHAYLLRLRVERARDLLARGMGPTEVAAMAGFADLSHLSRHFKRVTGLTPGVFARQIRASVALPSPWSAGPQSIPFNSCAPAVPTLEGRSSDPMADPPSDGRGATRTRVNDAHRNPGPVP